MLHAFCPFVPEKSVYRRFHFLPEPNSVTGRSHDTTMGMIFFSPGASVNLTAMAPASGSPLLSHGAVRSERTPSFAKAFQTSLPSLCGEKVVTYETSTPGDARAAMVNCPSHALSSLLP